MRAAIERIAQTARQRRLITLSRCIKACFLDPKTGELTLEGRTVLADLSEQAKLHNSGIRRNAAGELDSAELIRIEGRREIVLRLTNFLKLDQRVLEQNVEVDDGKN